ncbi:MAG: SdiA-regulated domain-containing protein [Flavobacteriales bacterium]|nr:SdiA-regulated domain-containing protein [Flavobacteriales bacterium]
MNLLGTFVILSSILTLSCSGPMVGPYDLGSPDSAIKLDSKLNEISGLQWISDSSIICIQDEKADVFYLNPETGKVHSKFDFGHNADFEGITHQDKRIYVLKSNGDIYISKNQNKAKSYDFKKDGPFDFEGLCMDSDNDRLLVACKDHGKKKKRDHIFVYSFSLTEKKYDSSPLFKISKEDVHPNFKPSAIAIHPQTKDIYILSSFSKTILVLTQDGIIKNNEQLNEYIFHQPEGITFTSDGTMYISNEKHDTYPTLLRFNPR